jgi:hypothetical protein
VTTITLNIQVQCSTCCCLYPTNRTHVILIVSSGCIHSLVTHHTMDLDGSTNPVPPLDCFQYSPEEQAHINAIEQEASSLFPQGKVYASRAHLREEVRDFAARKGFAVATDGNKICCTRSLEPISQAKARAKKNASGVVPMEKRRTYKSSTRCGCPFRITFSWVDSRNKDNTAVRVNGSCHFKHDNICLPYRGQLTVEKRKAGTHTKAINENQIKCILLLLNTNNKIHVKTMRDLIRPLFPPGHCLDSQFLFNFRLKAKRIIESRPEEVCDMTITRAGETDLLNVTSLDAQ